jgi:peptidoglycan/xylan/chitin deacetylase (PgdA/CDA1 family)
MRRNKNLFAPERRGGTGRILRTFGAVVILGTAIGLGVYFLFGKGYFTSNKPVVVDNTQPTVVETVPVVSPEDLVRNGNHIVMADDYAYATKDVRDWMTGKVPYTGEKLVFLTFDDGPNTESTAKILDVLKEEGVPGTFFVIGTSVEKAGAGEVLNRILEEGSSVALHTYSHVYEKLYPKNTGDAAFIQEELVKLVNAIRTATGKADFDSKVLRYPGGHMSWKGMDKVDEAIGGLGIEYVDWNAINGDSEPTSRRPKDAQAMADYVFDSLNYTKIKSVVVVLMHDATNKPLTPESLPLIIAEFKEQGYKFGILK